MEHSIAESLQFPYNKENMLKRIKIHKKTDTNKEKSELAEEAEGKPLLQQHNICLETLSLKTVFTKTARYVFKAVSVSFIKASFKNPPTFGNNTEILSTINNR